GQAGCLQRGNRRFAAGAGPLYPDLNCLHTELGRLVRTGLGGALIGERSTLAAALETNGARRGEAERVAVGVGDGHDGVVERRRDMGDAATNISPSLAFLALSHLFLSPRRKPTRKVRCALF